MGKLMELLAEVHLPLESDHWLPLLDELRYGNGFEHVIQDEIISQGRWYTTFRNVYRLPDGRYLALRESRGSTEMQDGSGEPWELYEVKPVQVTAIEYRRVP